MGFGISRIASIFGGKPDASTSDMGGFKPMKRLFSGVGPEPKMAFSQTFDAPKFQMPEVGNAGPATSNNPEQGDFWSKLQEMTRPGPAMSEYQQALRDRPDYNDYKPSKWRVLAATLGGIGGGASGGPEAGAKVAQNINEIPYARARQDWTDSVAGKGEAARIEQEQQEGLSRAYTDYLGRQSTQEKNAFDRWAKIQEIDLNERKFGEPEWIQTQDPDGGTYWINKKNPTSARIPTSMMTPEIMGAITGGRNAATGERNAATNERNATTNWENAVTNRGQLGVSQGNLTQRQTEHESDVFNRDRNFSWDRFKFFQPNAQEEVPATALTMREMAGEELGKQFIKDDGAGGFKVTPPANVNDPIWKQFQNEFRMRIEQKQRTFELPKSLVPMPNVEHGGVNVR